MATNRTPQPTRSQLDRVLTQLDTQGISRRSLLRLAAAGAAATAGGAFLTACGSSSSSGAAATGPTAVTDGKIIYLQFSRNEYQTIAGEGFLGAARQLGFKGALLDGKADPNNQLNQFNESLAGGQQGIFLNSVDGVNVKNLVSQATQDGVYFVNVFATTPWFTPWDGGKYYSLYGTPDEVGGASAVIDALSEALGGEGEVVRIQGIKGGSANEARTAGWDAGLAKHPGLKLVGDLFSEWTAETGAQAAEALLTKHPNAKAIITQAEDVATGAVAAIEKLGKVPGKDVLVVSVDGTKLGIERIQAGKQLASAATVPSYSGFLFATRLYDVLNGWEPGDGERMLQWEPTIVTSKNVKQWAARFVDLPAGDQFNAELLSHAKSPKDWDPQIPVAPIDIDALWGIFDKPKGFKYPAAYTKAKADGVLASTAKEYAAHYKAKVLGPVPA